MRPGPLLGIALSLQLAVLGSAWADTYPSRHIKLLVPGGPGGPTDVLARVTATHLQSLLGQNVIVENSPGAGGVIAARAVARAAPDGYTLLFANTGLLALIPAISKAAGYDPGKDLAAVSKVAESFQVLVVDAAFPARSLQDLISYATTRRGELNYASGGPGTLPHLAAELFKAKAGVEATHIPHKSDAEAITAILAKQVHLSFVNVAIALPSIQTGRLRPLAVTSAARTPDMPDVPTMAESGLADYVVTSFFGVMAPAGTPSTIISRLNVAINQALASRDVQASLAKFGMQAKPGTPQEFAAFIATEMHKWAAVAAAAQIRLD